MTIKIAFIDLDGVMNSISDVRKHLAPVYTDQASYWSEWHKAHTKEVINPAMVQQVEMLLETGYQVVFGSNRTSTCRRSTVSQLFDAGIVVGMGGLVMRNPLDNTPPHEFKADAVGMLLLGICIAAPTTKVSVFVYDDDEKTLHTIEHEIHSLAAGFDIHLSAIQVATFRGPK